MRTFSLHDVMYHVSGVILIVFHAIFFNFVVSKFQIVFYLHKMLYKSKYFTIQNSFLFEINKAMSSGSSRGLAAADAILQRRRKSQADNKPRSKERNEGHSSSFQKNEKFQLVVLLYERKTYNLKV